MHARAHGIQQMYDMTYEELIDQFAYDLDAWIRFYNNWLCDCQYPCKMMKIRAEFRSLSSKNASRQTRQFILQKTQPFNMLGDFYANTRSYSPWPYSLSIYYFKKIPPAKHKIVIRI